MKAWNKLVQKFENHGQSLVETALFLPILIFMLLGIVEISNLLITQNRVTTASRMAAGFGASNYDRANWATDQFGTAYDMGIVALNTVTETMDLDGDLWDVWSIRAQTNAEGTDFEEFEATHVYGNHLVVTVDEWVAAKAKVRQDILDSLQSACPDEPGSCAADLEVVVSVPFHNIETILGFNIWQWTGLRRIQGLTVLRVRPIVEAQGCPILPITVRLTQYSIYPSNWIRGEEGNLNWKYFKTDPVDLFPVGTGPDGFDYPVPPPIYRNDEIQPLVNASSDSEAYLSRNVPGIPIREAVDTNAKYAGNIYWAREISGAGNFGWLSWRDDEDKVALEKSLTLPGNFNDYNEEDPSKSLGYEGSTSDRNTTGFEKFFKTGNDNGLLETGEWITNYPGHTASVNLLIEGYIKEETPVSVLVFDMTSYEWPGAPGTGNNFLYRAYAFITVILRGHHLSGDDKWIMFEYVNSSLNCGLPDHN